MQKEKQAGRQTERLTDGGTVKQVDRQTYRQIDKKPDR